MRWQLRLGAQGRRFDLDPHAFGVADPGRAEYAWDGPVIRFVWADGFAASSKSFDSAES